VDEVVDRETTALSATARVQYRKQVEAFIHDNRTHTTIAKLTKNLRLEKVDLQELEQMFFASAAVESRAKFEEVYRERSQSVPRFIISLVGMDREAAKAAFSQYLVDNQYSADQIQFIEQIINHLTKNGTMDPKLLYGSPFTDLDDEGLDGLFEDDEAGHIVDILHAINEKVAS